MKCWYYLCSYSLSWSLFYLMLMWPFLPPSVSYLPGRCFPPTHFQLICASLFKVHLLQTMWSWVLLFLIHLIVSVFQLEYVVHGCLISIVIVGFRSIILSFVFFLFPLFVLLICFVSPFLWTNSMVFRTPL